MGSLLNAFGYFVAIVAIFARQQLIVKRQVMLIKWLKEVSDVVEKLREKK